MHHPLPVTVLFTFSEEQIAEPTWRDQPPYPQPQLRKDLSTN